MLQEKHQTGLPFIVVFKKYVGAIPQEVLAEVRQDVRDDTYDFRKHFLHYQRMKKFSIGYSNSGAAQIDAGYYWLRADQSLAIEAGLLYELRTNDNLEYDNIGGIRAGLEVFDSRGLFGIGGDIHIKRNFEQERNNLGITIKPSINIPRLVSDPADPDTPRMLQLQPFAGVSIAANNELEDPAIKFELGAIIVFAF